MPLPPLVEAVAEKVVVAEAAVDQAVVDGVACGGGGTGARSAIASVVVEGDEGEAGDDVMLLDIGGKLGSALWLLLLSKLILSLLHSKVLVLLWPVLSCIMDEVILLRLLIKLPVAVDVLP